MAGKHKGPLYQLINPSTNVIIAEMHALPMANAYGMDYYTVKRASDHVDGIRLKNGYIIRECPPMTDSEQIGSMMNREIKNPERKTWPEIMPYILENVYIGRKVNARVYFGQNTGEQFTRLNGVITAVSRHLAVVDFGRVRESYTLQDFWIGTTVRLLEEVSE